MRVILASKSPRRRELLKMAGIHNFEIIPALEDEVFSENMPADEAMKALAEAKAKEVFAETDGERTVIAADTLVFLDGKPLGKPRDEMDAFLMLKSLSAKRHEVKTGVCVINAVGIIAECETTAVYFRDLSDEEIMDYIKTGEPMDKAGAYGIQALGSVFIPKIEGDFFNVCGLPVCRLHEMLRKASVIQRQEVGAQ